MVLPSLSGDLGEFTLHAFRCCGVGFAAGTWIVLLSVKLLVIVVEVNVAVLVFELLTVVIVLLPVQLNVEALVSVVLLFVQLLVFVVDIEVTLLVPELLSVVLLSVKLL